MAIEKEISQDAVVDMRETLGSENQGDFDVLENLACVNVFNVSSEVRQLALEALSSLLGTPVQVVTMTTREEIFVYLSLNGLEAAVLFVGVYPNKKPVLQEASSERAINALKKAADDKPGIADTIENQIEKLNVARIRFVSGDFSGAFHYIASVLNVLQWFLPDFYAKLHEEFANRINDVWNDHRDLKNRPATEDEIEFADSLIESILRILQKGQN